MARKSKGTRERERKAQGMGEFTGRLALVFDPHEYLRPKRTTGAQVVKGSTDVELMFQTVAAAFEILGYDRDPRLVAGAMASLVNRFTRDLRKAIVNHVVLGNNLFISPAIEYHCKECGREDLVDDGAHAKPGVTEQEGEVKLPHDLAGSPHVCKGEVKETNTYDVHMGREFEPLLSIEDQAKMKAAELGIWTPGGEEPLPNG